MCEDAPFARSAAVTTPVRATSVGHMSNANTNDKPEKNLSEEEPQQGETVDDAAAQQVDGSGTDASKGSSDQG